MKKKVAITVFALLLHSGLVMPAYATSTTPVSQQHIVPLPKIASASVLVVDLDTHRVLYAEQANRTMPIASLTKLMTALVVLDAKQSMNEIISVDIHQTHELKGVYSRVRVGSRISRMNMLLMALMSSENRAAASLAHHYPGGYQRFIQAMNRKARDLGMLHTHYVEPTGLSEHNVSSASDLIKLLKATEKYPLLSRLSTTAEADVSFSHPRYSLPFRNTNRLVRRADWDILLTKTGFTNKAGRCLTMRTMLGDRQIGIVLLDAYGKYTTFADANRLRQWLEAKQALKVISSDA